MLFNSPYTNSTPNPTVFGLRERRAPKCHGRKLSPKSMILSPCDALRRCERGHCGPPADATLSCMIQHRRPEFSSISALLERDSQNRDRLRSQRPTHLSSVSKSSVLAARSPAVTASQTLRSSKSVKTTPNANQKQVGLWSAFPPPKLGWATLRFEIR